MNMMIGSLRSTLGKAIVLCACALTLVGDTSAAPNSQDSSRAEQQIRQQNELTFTQIDFPGASTTAVSDINDRGQIVGFFADAAGILHGFLLDNGVYTQIDHPGGLTTIAYGINDRGQIVGHFLDAGQGVHRYLLENGVFTEVVFPGEVTRIFSGGAPPIGINDRGPDRE